ncbi:acid phosphatase AphA [Oceanivirga salmonicida]|uniref:acid phosphatase AphA n=1 Tax=Oceanivirga salmonicida TaxID=1769291 RepID=UPI00083482F2|nr:acid phosphatase AphA [Oceanivirga salmonicida]
MKKGFKLLILALMCTTTISMAKGPKVAYTNQGFYTNAPEQVAVNFVSVDDIKKSLEGKAPMTVSFDIDDTLLFSSQYFHYGFTFGKELGFGSNPREVLNSQKFWDYVAEQEDRESIPKKVAKELIKMHLERGDKIVFITGRTPHSKAKNGIVNGTSKVLQKYFEMPKASPIWYTSETVKGNYKYDKSYYIKKVNSKIHYGDSDSDILAAMEVGIRAIRVQRAYNSTNPQNLNGGYGEEVVINSAW